MAYELKDGQGTLFISEYYEDGGDKPKHYGEIKFNQEIIDKIVKNGFMAPISGWEKKGDGWELISLSVNIFQLNKSIQKKEGGPFEKIHGEIDKHNNTQSDIPEKDVPF